MGLVLNQNKDEPKEFRETWLGLMFLDEQGQV